MFKNKLKISYYGATKTEDGIGLASKLHLEALKKHNFNNNLLIKLRIRLIVPTVIGIIFLDYIEFVTLLSPVINWK